MKSEERTQPTDLSVLSRSELERRYLNLETEYKSALAKITWYEEQYKLAQQRRYGKSSEKGITSQMSLEDYGVPLFNEAEACREPRSIPSRKRKIWIRRTSRKSAAGEKISRRSRSWRPYMNFPKRKGSARNAARRCTR